VYDAIVARFGPSVVRPDGELDRPALRARVLADPAALADLNAIVHPAVRAERARLLADARARGDAVVVDDIPLLFEADDPGAFDGVILVDAPESVRRERLLRDRGLDPAVADRLLAAQLPAAEKRARATWIIDNDGDLTALERRVREVWDAIAAR
jgi:dephospho-CoA kinase